MSGYEDLLLFYTVIHFIHFFRGYFPLIFIFLFYFLMDC